MVHVSSGDVGNPYTRSRPPSTAQSASQLARDPWSIYPAHVPRPHNGVRIRLADEAESALPLAALGVGHDPVARTRAGGDDERPASALLDAARVGIAPGLAAAAARRVRRLGARFARRRRARRRRGAGHLSASGTRTRAPAGAQG